MKVFVIAGEVSGDKLGQAVMAGLRQLVPAVSFDGVGGPLMQAEGLVSRFDNRSQPDLKGRILALKAAGRNDGHQGFQAAQPLRNLNTLKRDWLRQV